MRGKPLTTLPASTSTSTTTTPSLRSFLPSSSLSQAPSSVLIRFYSTSLSMCSHHDSYPLLPWRTYISQHTLFLLYPLLSPLHFRPQTQTFNCPLPHVQAQSYSPFRSLFFSYSPTASDLSSLSSSSLSSSSSSEASHAFFLLFLYQYSHHLCLAAGFPHTIIITSQVIRDSSPNDYCRPSLHRLTHPQTTTTLH